MFFCLQFANPSGHLVRSGWFKLQNARLDYTAMTFSAENPGRMKMNGVKLEIQSYRKECVSNCP